MDFPDHSFNPWTVHHTLYLRIQSCLVTVKLNSRAPRQRILRVRLERTGKNDNWVSEEYGECPRVWSVLPLGLQATALALSRCGPH